MEILWRGETRLRTSRGIKLMVGAEAEIKDKDERKPQIPKAWLNSAACWNLSSGKSFFIWGFVLIRLVWEGETADLSTLHSQM